jgi:hypothetical protein
MQTVANTKFARPVTIRLRRNGRDEIVVDASRAARLLMCDWPEDSVKRQSAMAACLLVLRGEAFSHIV